MLALDLLKGKPRCRSGLEAYRQISDALDLVEDEHLGIESWRPPRTFIGQPASDRMYATYPESMLAVPGYPGVTALWHATEVVFVSRFGAIEVRERDDRSFSDLVRSHDSRLLFERFDAYGDTVWDEKNQR